ncbi:hypothetical protein BH24ACT3_BH24ACT3_08400 [soil metagenome]
MRKLFSRPWPLGEFLDQCWFIAKVTTVPVILISIPFGMVISLQVGSLVSQLGAEAHLGSSLVLAVVREQAPIAAALLIVRLRPHQLRRRHNRRRLRPHRRLRHR